MKIFLNIAILIALFATSVPASARGNAREREAWMKEMQELKRDYLIKELSLSKEQQQTFLPVYESMENEIHRLFDSTRALEKNVEKKGDKASAAEIEKAADALYNCKAREGAIEQKFYPRFKKMLTPRQLLKLKAAERRFQRQMVRQHFSKKRQKKSAR